MITVHHLNNSRSQRLLWLLEELGVDYAIERHQRDPRTQLAPPALRRIHPLGKSPVLTDGDRTVAESGAIIEYLLAHHGEGRFTPEPGTPEAERNRYYMHYAEGSLMPPLVMRLVFGEVRKRAPLLVRPIAAGIAAQVESSFIGPTIAAHVAMLEAELEGRSFITGDALAAADFQMSFPLQALAARSGGGTRHPNIDAYLARIAARSAYQRGLERGGPFELG